MRRGKLLESKVNGLKAVMQDLKAEASFFYSTASDVGEVFVEIKEYDEDNSTKMVSQSGSVELESLSVDESDNKMGVPDDGDYDDYDRIMVRLEELAADDNDENDEDQDANVVESVGDEDELTKAPLHRKMDGLDSLHGQQNSESRRSFATIFQLLQGIRDVMASKTENSKNDRDRDREMDRYRERECVILINPFNQSIIVQGSYNSNQHLAENDPSRYGTPPAQKEAIEAMPTVTIKEYLQCFVCLDDFKAGSEANE